MKMLIGQETTKTIKEFGLNSEISQLDWFFKLVFKFYKKVAAMLIKYFKSCPDVH